MKKIIAIIITAILVLTGCLNENKKIIIKSFIMSYNISTEKNNEDYNMLYVFFENEETYITYRNHAEKIDYKYNVIDVEILKDYIKSINTNVDERNKNSSESPQAFLWSIYFETNEKEYSYTGFDDYPDYWDELWQVLLETSEAESLEDFGFE